MELYMSFSSTSDSNWMLVSKRTLKGAKNTN